MSAPSEELRIVEAFLFASPEPVSEEDIAGRLPQGTDVPTRGAASSRSRPQGAGPSARRPTWRPS
jgi:chromosome segregation and condensation protein ScpB